MKKTILLLTLALCLCCVFCRALADGDYTVDSRNRITKYTGPGGDVTVPAEIGGKPVTTVQRAVFMNNGSVTSLRFEEGIQSIGDSATYKTSALTEVVLPDTARPLDIETGALPAAATVRTTLPWTCLVTTAPSTPTPMRAQTRR